MKIVIILMVGKTLHDPTATELTALPGHGHAKENQIALMRPMTKKCFSKNALTHGQEKEPVRKQPPFLGFVSDERIVLSVPLLCDGAFNEEEAALKILSSLAIIGITGGSSFALLLGGSLAKDGISPKLSFTGLLLEYASINNE